MKTLLVALVLMFSVTAQATEPTKVYKLVQVDVKTYAPEGDSLDNTTVKLCHYVSDYGVILVAIKASKECVAQRKG